MMVMTVLLTVMTVMETRESVSWESGLVTVEVHVTDEGA